MTFEYFQHVNDAQMRMSVVKVVKNAEAIFLQLKQVENMLPESIKGVLSQASQPKSDDLYADEYGGLLIDTVDPVTSLSGMNFSEMYKSVISTSPSLVVPPLIEDSEMDNDQITL